MEAIASAMTYLLGFFVLIVTVGLPVAATAFFGGPGLIIALIVAVLFWLWAWVPASSNEPTPRMAWVSPAEHNKLYPSKK